MFSAIDHREEERAERQAGVTSHEERHRLIWRLLNYRFDRQKLSCAGSRPAKYLYNHKGCMEEMQRLDALVSLTECSLEIDGGDIDLTTETMLVALSRGSCASCLDERTLTEQLMVYGFTSDQIEPRMGEIIDARVCPETAASTLIAAE